VIDEIVDINDRIIGRLFNRARRNHEEQFQQSGKAINEKVRLFYRVGHALLEAKQNGSDPFKAIEAVIPWEAFTRSVIERSLFTLDWLQNVELRRRVQAGLNKGEARNALARAVFFNRLGEMRDRSFENQRYRASGLNLVTAAIVLWNTVYLERVIRALRDHGQAVDQSLLQNLSPLGWEHINLTGDYLWRHSRRVQPGKFRPLRPFLQA
jgi:hypothetical protein